MNATPSMRRLLEVAEEAARAGGAKALAHFKDGVSVETKKDGTPVSRADRESEATIRAILGKAFPDHAVLGEESGEERSGATHRWIVDPVDGTVSFVAGVPLWGVLVGLEIAGDPVVGVMHLPAMDETYVAARGEGCSLNGWPCHVSTTARVEDALVVTTSPRELRRRAPGYAAFAERAKRERGWSDCYGYGLVASGRADVAMDNQLSPWDLCAVVPIVEEAGGRLTDWRGERTIHAGTAIVSNGLLHDAALAAMRA
jgi:histidinol-phosphatase